MILDNLTAPAEPVGKAAKPFAQPLTNGWRCTSQYSEDRARCSILEDVAKASQRTVTPP